MFHGLSFTQLETFHWAARLGSFSAAAIRLNTTQPAVSGRIRGIETALKLSLFDRTGRLPKLTAKGQELAAQVERIMALGEAFESLVGPQAAIAGLVRVGAADTVALTWLPLLMAELGSTYPRINVELVVDLSVNLRDRLLHGDLDIAFMVGDISRPGFEMRRLGPVEQRWMCSPALGVPDRVMGASELVAWPIFTHSRGSHLYHTVQRWFEADGVRAERLHGCNSLATMIAMTTAGLGISVLPPKMLLGELEARKLAVIRTDRAMPDNEFVAVYSIQPLRATVRIVADLAAALVRGSPVFGAQARTGRRGTDRGRRGSAGRPPGRRSAGP
ncbi:MAG: LysR family transcriptional regulator [Pseudomonadota bacterium]